MILLNIVIEIIFPIFALLGIGFVLNKAFELETSTLTRILFWVFSPTIVFLTIVETELVADDVIGILAFTIIQSVTLGVITWGVFSLPGLNADRPTMAVGTGFFNAANYGFPLVALAFGEEAIGVQAIVVLAQALLIFTVGIALMDDKTTSLMSGLKQLIRVPVIWAIILGFVVLAAGVSIPEPLKAPMTRISDAYIAIALITLGAQLSNVRISEGLLSIAPAIGLRLLFSPVVAVGLLLTFNFRPEIGLPLMLAAGLPAPVNTYILAVEYNRDPDLASLLVFWSTVFSALTLPVLLLLIRQFFA